MSVKKYISVALVIILAGFTVVPCDMPVFSAGISGIVTHKTAFQNSVNQNVFDVSLDAYQAGQAVPTDIVMVLDVSGSMAWGIPVSAGEEDTSKTYYIEATTYQIINGQQYRIISHLPVSYTDGQWHAEIDGVNTVITISDTQDEENGCYRFYTGFLNDLKAAASSFAASIAQNAEEYGVDHRIAVVEFSSGTRNSETYSLNTHTAPYYANILTGDNKSPSGALVSAYGEADTLGDIFNALTAKGPTYSDDALSQAVNIFGANPAEGRNRAVILFTDGGPGSYGWTGDTDSSALSTANGAIAAAHTLKSICGASVYTIGMFGEENMSGETGEKNTVYLNCISSNYPDAQSMTLTGEKTAEHYCSIGSANLPLESIFNEISTIIGESLYCASVTDTISDYFYLTDSQKLALQTDYGATVTENADGTTAISASDVDFKPVGVDENGSPLDPDNEGIFRLNYSMTVKEGFWGGGNVPAGVSGSGVYTSSGSLAEGFPAAAVDVPSQGRPQFTVDTNDLTVAEGTYVSLESLYDEAETAWASSCAEIDYSAEYPGGTPFNGANLTESTDFTVKAAITVGSEEYEYTATARVTVTHYIPVTGIVCVSENIGILAGGSVSLGVKAVPENATEQGITYSISGDAGAVAHNEETGEVTGIRRGIAVVTATTVSGGYSVGITVTVGGNPRTITAPEISGCSYTTVSLKNVTGYTGDGNVEYGFSISPDNPEANVAEWTDSVTFSGLDTGTTYYFFARVTGSGYYADAYSSGTSAATLSLVRVTGLSITTDSTVLYYKSSASATLAAEVTPANSTVRTVKWRSSNTNVVLVDENTGRLTPVKKGSATVTATLIDADNKIFTDTCTVTVKYYWWQWLIIIFLFGWIWYI